MKKIVFAFMLTMTCALCAAQAAVVDKIAVVVNNEAVTMSEIDRMLMPVYAKYKATYTDERELVKKLEEARQKIVEQLIEDKLIVSEAKRQNIEVDDKELSAKIAEIEKQFASKNAFTKALMEQHLSIKELKTRYREQMMSRRLIDRKIGAKILVTPVDVHTYYNGHISDFIQPGEVKLRNILIKVKDESDIDRASALARDIETKLKAGEDFSTLAQAHSEGPGASEGGLMGYVKKDDLMPELEKAVWEMKEGEISGVVQSPVGYHIFKVDEVRSERTLTVKDAYKEIEDLLFREKIRVKIKGWVDTLRKNAYIAFK